MTDLDLLKDALKPDPRLVEDPMHTSPQWRGRVFGVDVMDVSQPDGRTGRRELVHHNGGGIAARVAKDVKVLSNLIVPGLLMLVIMLTTCYALGNEWKRGSQKRLFYDIAGEHTEYIILGKLLPQTVVYVTIFWVIDLVFYSYLQFPCHCGVTHMMMWGVLTVIASQGFGLLMFEAFPGQMRMAMSGCSLLGVMQFSLAGFSFPVSAMDPTFQWLSNIFPLHHYFLIYVNQALNGYPIHYAWTSVAALVAIAILPALFMYRLTDAFINKDYKA